MWTFRKDSKQWESITESNSRLNIWTGSVRSGKTVASLARWAHYVHRSSPPGPLLMIGKTERTLKRNILDPLMEVIPQFSYNTAKGEASLFGRLIYLVGANDDRSEHKIRGMTLAGAYGDELTLYPESFFKMLLSRLSVTGAKFFGTTNPDNPSHYIKRDFIDRGDLDMSVFPFKLRDNVHLSEEYISALESEYTGLWYSRFIEGKWVSAHGAVYDMWDSDEHIRTLYYAPDYYTVGVDYGTHNPCVFLLIAHRNGRAHVVKEYYYDSAGSGRRKTDAEYTLDLADFVTGYPVSSIYIDPSAASFLLSTRAAGLPVRAAKNDVLPGIAHVANLLGAGRLSASACCESLTREMQGYVWDTKAASIGTEKPIKSHDHAPDALRYALYSDKDIAPIEYRTTGKMTSNFTGY